jgi:hypothetical protein
MIDLNDLATEVRVNIASASANSARSLQKAVGPSEVGGACVRKIGYRLTQTSPTNQSDTWLATIGTAVHAYLAGVYERLNETLPQPRYLVEHRVVVDPDLDFGGSCDLVDLERKVVIDWKVVGDSSLKRYKADGVGDQYRTQAHLYAWGLIREGILIEDVCIVFLPRGGSLRGLHIWSEPFNIEIAAAGIERLKQAKEIVAAGGKNALPMLPATESFCHYCSYYLPGSTDVSVGCPGGDLPAQPRKERR